MTRILIFADWFDPGHRGGGLIRSCVNVARLLKDSHEVYVFTRNRDFNTNERFQGIECNQWSDFEDGICIFYCSDEFLKFNTIQTTLHDVDPDFLYLNSMYSYYFSLIPIWLKYRKKIRAEVILAPRGMLHDGALQFKPLKKKLFLWMANLIGLYDGLTIHATSTYERSDIEQHLGKITSITIPDLPSIEKHKPLKTTKSNDLLKCLFLSRVTPKKNLLYLLNLLQDVKVKVELTIVGGIDDTEYWHRCQQLIKQLPINIKVQYHGLVPHDSVAEQLSQADLFILPTYGENFGHVIFEALAQATPVLISDQTPWVNLEEKNAGWAIPLKEKTRFRQIIETVAEMNQTEYETWSSGARKTALDYLADGSLINGYKNLFHPPSQVLKFADSEHQNYIIAPSAINK